MAPWRLPWRDFHPLVNNSFSGRAVECPFFFAHARMQPQIEDIIRDTRYERPVFCTPEELLEE
jgi:hypothetical protein